MFCLKSLRCFGREGVLTKAAKMISLRSTQKKIMALLLRPRENDENDKIRVHAYGVVRQHSVLRRVLRRFWEGFWGRVLRRVLRRGSAVGFTVTKGSEKGSQKGF